MTTGKYMIDSKVLAYWRKDGFFTLADILLNPKMAIFYLAFLPQFINPGDPVMAKSLLLATIHLLEGVIWLSVIISFIGQIRRQFARPSVQRNLQAAAGVILIGLGLNLATERR
jgi:threonine/homoserine/homoserine lactone efflux protein